MKRLRKLANSAIGSPFIHRKINNLILNELNASKNMSREEFLVAKQLLSDLPMIPTSERIYDLTDQLRLGLFDELFQDEDFNRQKCYDNWQWCLNTTKEYLRGIGILCSNEKGGMTF